MRQHHLSLKTKDALVVFLTAVLLLPLAGCGRTDDPADETVAEPAVTWEEPDYSDFVMPEETDTLVVYGYGFASTMLSDAIGIFRKTYPEVNLDYRAYDEDEYHEILRTEIPAGRGPDFVFGYTNDFPDVYKTMQTGLFEDLNPYLMNDPEFDMSEYNQAVLDGGILYGRR